MYFLWIILWKTLNKFWLIGFFHKKIFFSFNLYTYISIQIFDPTLEFYLNTRDNELKTWIYTTWACFHISNSISGYLDFGRKIFLVYSYFIVRPLPNCSTILPPGNMIWIILNIRYLKILSLQSHLKRFFTIYFCISWPPANCRPIFPLPKDKDLNKPQITLPEDAPT